MKNYTFEYHNNGKLTMIITLFANSYSNAWNTARTFSKDKGTNFFYVK